MLAHELAISSENLVVLPEFRLIEILLAEGDATVRNLDAHRLYALFLLDRQIKSLCLTEDELFDVARETQGQGIRVIMEELVSKVAMARRIRPDVAVIKLGSLASLYQDLAELFPEMVFMHVVRDPRAVVNSLLKSERPYFPGEKMGRGDVVFSTLNWRKRVNQVAGLSRCSHMVLNVSYESLCRDRTAVIRKLLDALGAVPAWDMDRDRFFVAESEKDIHALVGQQPDTSRIDSWQNELQRWKIVLIELLLRDALTSRGYGLYALDHSSVMQKGGALAMGGAAFAWHMGLYYFRRIVFYGSRWDALLNRIKLYFRRVS